MRWKLLDAGPPATYAVVLAKGDEVMRELGRIVRKQRIEAASITAIGAFERAVLGYFDWETKEYKRNPVEEQVEVLSLLGDVAVSDQGPALHLHAVLGKARRQHARRPPARRPCPADARTDADRAAGASAQAQGPRNRTRADRSGALLTCRAKANAKPSSSPAPRAGSGARRRAPSAKGGANVGLLARGVEGLEAAAREVAHEGGAALVLPADVADADAVERAAAAVEERFGPIDIWVNCAMATIFSPFTDLIPDEYRRATEVTYLGYVYGTMAALRRMKVRDRGTIVQVGSALAYRAIPLQSVYCGAKFAIRGFTDSIRCELLHDKSRVHITMVQMPALNTPQFDWARNKTGKRAQPLPPIYQPELAAEAIVYAALARRREIYVGGSAAKAILANKIMPGLLDRYLARQGYSGQLTDAPVPNDAPDNLYHPVPRDYGAHGRFDGRASSWSVQFWLTRHRSMLLAGAGLAAAAAMVWLSPGGRRYAQKLLPG